MLRRLRAGRLACLVGWQPPGSQQLAAGQALLATRVAAAESKPQQAPAADAEAQSGARPLGAAGLPVVAVVGRPNVGKSALFNRLVRRRDALVHNTPEGHVTRDYKEGRARLGDMDFCAIDTSGLEPFMDASSLQARATALTEGVVRRSDVALLLLDARSGISMADSALADWLRRTVATPVLLAANKCERRGAGGTSEVSDVLAEATRLGYGEPVAISAETGEGMADLYVALRPHLEAAAAARAAAAQADEAAAVEKRAREGETAAGDKCISLTLMGLPNVGKSTLANRLLGRERSLTGPEPGLTRDVVRATFRHGDYSIRLMDTAGRMRKRRLANYDDSEGHVAAMTLAQGSRSMQLSQTVALLLDAPAVLIGAAPTRAEISLASDIAEEGRSLVVVANKTDALSPAGRHRAVQVLREKFEAHVPEVAGVPILPVSALTGSGTAGLMPAVMAAYDVWTRRIPTSRLNRWLERLVAQYAGTGGPAKELAKIRYITQVKARPPTFAVFTRTDDLSDRTRRQLVNAARREFDFAGVPIRILVRPSREHEKKRQKSSAKAAAAH